MEMTIDTAISWLPNIAEHKGEYISICNEDVEAIKIGVETMHKYQKIKEQVDIAIDKENFAISGARLIQIREIIEGNDD